MLSRPTWNEEKTMATLVEQAAGKEQGTLTLELTRVIKASRQRVFDAWTRPEYMRQWFGPKEKGVGEIDLNPHAGGDYRIEMRGADCAGVVGGIDLNRTSMVAGRYVKVVPHELLVFTWRGDWNIEEETLVTVALRDVEGGTEVKLTHERFTTEASRDQHEHGWTGSFEKLVAFAQS
jgi:uncharacterized protein YndB with AHSA1/START domain